MHSVLFAAYNPVHEFHGVAEKLAVGMNKYQAELIALIEKLGALVPEAPKA